MSEGSRLVFLLGVAPRSGTNFVADLLGVHPECEIVRDPPEDGVLRSAHHLVAFEESLRDFYARWGSADSPTDDKPPSIRTPPLEVIGGGLISWLTEGTEAPVVVSKTPFTDNIGLVPDLVPEARVVVVARDGRDVAESTRRSWGSPLDVAIERWRRGVRNVRDVVDQRDTSGWLTIVKYEDLLLEREATLRTLLADLGLDVSCYDFEAADNLAIRGSSTHQGAQGRLSWDPVDPAGFAGGNRSATWSPAEHALFATMAGEEAEWLGYDLPPMVWNAAAANSYSGVLALRRTLWDAVPTGLKRRLRGR